MVSPLVFRPAAPLKTVRDDPCKWARAWSRPPATSCPSPYSTACGSMRLRAAAKGSSGVKLSTNSFTYPELELLCSALKKNFDLNCSIQSTGYTNQFIIYIKSDSMNKLNKIVLPYFVESMKRKLHF